MCGERRWTGGELVIYVGCARCFRDRRHRHLTVRHRELLDFQYTVHTSACHQQIPILGATPSAASDGEGRRIPSASSSWRTSRWTPSSSSTSSSGPASPSPPGGWIPASPSSASSTSSAPDLILSDYTLPRFDGMTALSLARERAPAVPFLIVTGSVNEETAVGCMKAGATDYLLKSNLARIGPAIEGALARVRARDGEGPRGGGAPPLRGEPARHLQQQPPGLRPDRPRRHDQGAQHARPSSGAPGCSAARIHEGDADGGLHPRSGGRLPRRAGRRGPQRRALPARHRRRRSVGSRPPTRRSWTRGHGHRRLPQRAGHQRRGSRPSRRSGRARPATATCSTTRATWSAPPIAGGQFLYVNRAWHARHRYCPTPSSPGRGFLDVVHPDSRERYERGGRAGRWPARR